MILLLDNFDSFTWNLADYVERLGQPCQVIRNTCEPGQIDWTIYKGVIISPGPGTPQKANNLPLLLRQATDRLPVLGICLGHQAIGMYYGARLLPAKQPMHGKISNIFVKDDCMFQGMPPQFGVVRYHSLLLQQLPGCLLPTAWTADGELMAMRHYSKPLWGVQYHPEAILTEHGSRLLANWLNLLAS